MRLENCIRRWLRLKAHRVVTIREIAGKLIAEIQPLEGGCLVAAAVPRRSDAPRGGCLRGGGQT
jgi:hypothetical protein